MFLNKMAETVRFELTVPLAGYDALARRWIRPLSHISNEVIETIKKMAEDTGFEPAEPFGSTVFKTAAIDHSANPPLTVGEILSVL
jgi:hypothetical protein